MSTTRQKPKPVNIPSALLSNEENDSVFNMLGRGCTTLATAVAQLLIALPESRTKWTKKATGAVCFVKDCSKKSYFIRVYDIIQKCMVWEQELYNQFKYFTSLPFFHTFAADKYRALE
ncbi:predicted protein [Nematostella vectensis]|uniref:WH1 domain-containing protein n=1 Tax=Nematostella vectensis TaxID=45351 RepID=A7TAK7_NEMVE|nr:predicted protein [Nematostella vectensis]|eukprot:XP_001619064.1 hypothetical protein NEMVEDRAFT_v1g224549 [Nematostella vectensis]